MPYKPEHKQATRKRIIESARVLFNRCGVADVSIDQIMSKAGLTRGGFYHHFKNKEELFAEAVTNFLHGQGAEMRSNAGVNTAQPGLETIQRMINGYLSTDHLGDLDGQCPLIALPSDISRAGDTVKESYQQLLEAMVGLFESNLGKGPGHRDKALTLATMCVGGMVLARTLPDQHLADELRNAARDSALAMLNL
ncbi:MAG: TetR/AcrR family transcriptional regulator [Pseudomonadales bacterium]|nr:TetR/AcrR family transcriptional regulator [Pseudomonadales bacterium]